MISITDTARPAIYIGSQIFSSFFTPEMVVKVVAPVNWRARYDEMSGKRISADAFRNHRAAAGGCQQDKRDDGRGPGDAAPSPQRNGTGMKGRSAGVTNAPASTLVKAEQEKGPSLEPGAFKEDARRLKSEDDQDNQRREREAA